MKIGATSFKVEQWRNITVTTTMISSLAKEARNISTVDSSRTCFNRRSRKNKCSNGVP